MPDNDERIETYINRNGIQGDTDFFLAQLNELNAAFDRINSIKLTLGKDNSFKTAIDSAGKLSTETTKLAASVDNYRSVQNQATQIAQQAIAAYSGGSESILKQANSLVNLKLALQQNAALQKEYKKGLDDGTLSLEQYQEKTAAAIITQKEYQASIAAVNKELLNTTKSNLSPQITSPRAAPGAAVITPTVPGNLEEEQAALAKTGEVVNDLERAEAGATVQANEWAAAQRAAAVSSEEAATAQSAALTQLERSAQVLAQNKLSLSENVAAQKEFKEQLEAGELTQDQYIAKTAQAILEQNELKVSIAALNKELSLAAKADLAVPGSQGAATAENAQLTNTRVNTPVAEGIATPEDLANVAAMNELIDKNNQLIDENTDKLGRQKINIGNYPTAFVTAFTTLETELGKVNTALQAPGLSGKDLSDLTLKQTALQNATALVSKEFSTTTAQANAYKESAKQVGAVYGTNSELFKTYATQVAAGATETQKLGTEVENAGKKSNVFATGFKNIYSTLRQVAQAIPGIGIAGLIGLLLEPLGALASSLFNVGNKTVDLKDKQSILQDTLKRTSEVLDSLGGEAGKGAVEVDNLKNHIEEAKQGLVSSNDVVELYNSTIGKTTGAVNSLAEAEDQIAKKGDAYIKYTILKAAAQLAASKSAAALVEAEVAAEKPTQDFNTIGSRLSSFGAGQVSAPGAVPGGASQLAAGLQARNDAAKAAQDKAIAQKKNESDEFLKVEAKFVADYEKIASQLGFNPDGQLIQEDNEKAIAGIDAQIQALTRYENKQNEVAQTDTNTYEKRRQALINYNNAAAQLIKLNTEKSLVGVTNTNTISEALDSQNTQLQKAALDGYDKLTALDDAYRQRKLSAEEQIAEDQINETIKANEAVYKDDQQTLNVRLEAYRDYLAAQGKLADTQKNQKLAQAGFTDPEIIAYNHGLQVQLDGKRITSEELLAIDRDYETKIKNLANNGSKDVHDITLSYAKKTIEDVDNLNKGAIDSSATEKYSVDLQALNKSYSDRKISAAQYLSQLSQLNDDFHTKELQDQVAQDDKKLDQQKTADAKLKQDIENAKSDVEDAENTGDQHELDLNQTRLDTLYSQEQTANNKLKALQDQRDKDEAARNKAAAAQAKAIAEARQQVEIDIIKTSFNGIASIIDARYDNEKAAIQTTIDAINAKAQADVNAENETSDTAEKKAQVIADINGRAALQAQQLADKQKQIDHQKAEFDKAKAIADIVINTAVAISKAYAQGPTGIATIPLIAALGAVEIALVEAQPIPAYRLGAGVNGQPKHPGGDAIVGDGGKRELAVTPTGDIIVTPAKATKTSFPRDTVVLPDANAAIDALIYSSLRGLEQAEAPATDPEMLQAMQQLIRENRNLQKTLANKRETHFHGSWAGWEVGYRSGQNWTRYIDENTKFK